MERRAEEELRQNNETKKTEKRRVCMVLKWFKSITLCDVGPHPAAKTSYPKKTLFLHADSNRRLLVDVILAGSGLLATILSRDCNPTPTMVLLFPNYFSFNSAHMYQSGND